jgi:gas vesicle protein
LAASLEKSGHRRFKMARFDGSTSAVTFLLGLGIGAATALLLAPKTGDELRGDIADGVNDRVNQARTTVKKLGRRAQSVVDGANDRLQEVVEAGENAYAAAAAKRP